MTKAELEEILKTSLKDIHFRRPDETYEGVLNCMVEAYNKGIDDAVGCYVSNISMINSEQYSALEEVQRIKI